MAVAACITAADVCLGFAWGAGFLCRRFGGIDAGSDICDYGLFDCSVRLCRRTHTRLSALNTGTGLGRCNKASIGIRKIMKASHQAGLRIIWTLICPEVATCIWSGVCAVFVSCVWPRFWARVLPIVLTIFVAVILTIFAAIIRSIF